jgi:molybdopterin-containing oxidoreductase family iron-sulfur binding subunit
VTAPGFDPTRRRFLSAAAAAAGVTLAPGVTLYGIAGADPAQARAPGQPASAEAQENGLRGHGRPETDAQWIRKVELRNPESGATRALPVMCQHCAEPPCVDVCPTGASFKRADGIVLVDKHTCIGCRYCMMACPYKARSFVHEALSDQKTHAPRGKGTVESCTLCVHRVDSGRQPACVEACADAGGGAMLFGDLNDPDSEISRRVATYASSQIRADLGLDPGVRYRNL